MRGPAESEKDVNRSKKEVSSTFAAAEQQSNTEDLFFSQQRKEACGVCVHVVLLYDQLMGTD